MNNRILKALPAKEYRILSSQSKEVMLPKGAVLHEAGERIGQVYFPNDAMISYLSGTAEGESVEVCVVGNEGVVGIAALLSDSTAFRAVVQVPGSAVRISRDVLRREFKRGESLHRVLLHYTNALLIQVAQTAVCNKFHSVEERFCRWLLLAHDRTSGDKLPLTQETIARILGSRRASVSVVAGALQKKGVIEYSRGTITIRDRKRLESLACECYGTISAAHSKIDSHS
ncbi:MAG: Crp/Fnr family transcriptional regulator [Acidobacteria bacterium]|nr:MAG: Crp/Fnr family transcriptional regulator [Acidobacteriota bacterium]